MHPNRYLPLSLLDELKLSKREKQYGRIKSLIKLVDVKLKSFTSKDVFFIFSLKEAFVSLYTQGMDLSFKEVCVFHRRKKTSSLFMKRVRNYIKAIHFIDTTKASTSIDIQYLEKLHLLIEKDFGKVEEELGHIRKKQNWIGPKNCTIDQAYSLPPSPEEVLPLLKSLCSYIESDEDKIVQLALTFAQFLAIHPFMDGNGRVARLLIATMTKKKDLLSYPILFLSEFFLEHRKLYLQKLFDLYTDRKLDQWIGFFLKGLEEELILIELKLNKLQKLHRKIHHLMEFIDDEKTRIKACNFLFKNPSFTLSEIRKKANLSLSQSKKVAEILIQHGILKELSENVFLVTGLIRIAM